MKRKGCINKAVNRIILECKYCGLEWFDYPSRINRVYCSKRCKALHSNNLFKKGNAMCLGRKLTEEHKQKIAVAHKGKSRPNISRSKLGSKNPNWKGGTSPASKIIRRSRPFIEWRNQVFERDDYTCRECGSRGGELHPHHIKSFALYPELRFDLNNGVTLCDPCHRKTDTWSFSWCKKHKCPTEQK